MVDANRAARPAYLLRESFREVRRVRKRALANLSARSDEQIAATRAVRRDLSEENLNPTSGSVTVRTTNLQGLIRDFEARLGSKSLGHRCFKCRVLAIGEFSGSVVDEITTSSPSIRARVRIAPVFEPASDALMAIAHIVSPEASSGNYLALTSGDLNSRMCCTGPPHDESSRFPTSLFRIRSSNG